ncbi:ArdC family protein [Thiomicrorhabdus indica]|uniref:ArdC family protein n=1 Tax=Thiomicrorhabdus indica TaxID=2267253 RepID=UPI00102DB2F6|nr:zincin-like metallopeptidase domain-containing protein [Thiomicrorhabdus indica]
MTFKKKSNNKDAFEKITNQIVEALENGLNNESWKCPWDRMTSVATNAKTGKRLIGVSQIICYMSMVQHGFEVNRWLTFKQAIELGGKVIKGSKSTLVFWLRPFLKDENGKLFSPNQERIQQAMENGEEIIWSYRFAPYFNVEQIEGLDETFYQPLSQEGLSGLGETFSPITQAEAFVQLLKDSEDPFKLMHKGNKAFYSPLTDSVTVPEKGKFHSEQAYYATVLHEAGHWTGAENRLSREGIVDFDSFGSDRYAFEELIAELFSVFKAADIGFEREIDDSHVKYIRSWIKILKNDHKAIFKASQEAMKAVRFVDKLTDYQADLFDDQVA